MAPRRSAREIADELKRLSQRNADDATRLSLLHEVQVYQEELTVQNEALTRAQSALEETRDRFIDLYDFAPNGYMTLDQHGLILRINLTGATFIGKSRHAIEGMPLLGFVAPDSRKELLSFLRRCRTRGRRPADRHDHGADFVTELAFRCADERKDVQLVCRPRRNRFEDGPIELFVAIIDITERKRLELESAHAALGYAALARRLLSVQDDERQRTARDLHDNIGQ